VSARLRAPAATGAGTSRVPPNAVPRTSPVERGTDRQLPPTFVVLGVALKILLQELVGLALPPFNDCKKQMIARTIAWSVPSQQIMVTCNQIRSSSAPSHSANEHRLHTAPRLRDRVKALTLVSALVRETNGCRIAAPKTPGSRLPTGGKAQAARAGRGTVHAAHRFALRPGDWRRLVSGDWIAAIRSCTHKS
jgi:hypothetical protein